MICIKKVGAAVVRPPLWIIVQKTMIDGRMDKYWKDKYWDEMKGQMN